MSNKFCKICSKYKKPFQYYKAINGFFCEDCNEEKEQLNLNANTYNLRKLIDRVQSIENDLKEKEYELVLDLNPLAKQLGISIQECSEIVANNKVKIIVNS